MADTGLVLAGTGTNIAGAQVDWVNPSNITTDNATGATATLLSVQATDFLAATNYGFTTDSEIVGYEVEMDSILVPEAGYNLYITLNGTTIYSSIKGIVDFGVVIVGGPTDLWGAAAATSAQVNASTFGCLITGTDDGAGSSCSIDYVKMRVYYTNPVSNEEENLIVQRSGLRW